MKIEKIRCDQFAGIRDTDIAFDDGVNIIEGNNESGKSTLLKLLYALMFQSAKLDRRRDKAFISYSFPSSRISGTPGNVIDGTVQFETEDGIYKLTKEWDQGKGTVRLVCPDGTLIKGESSVEEVLSRELQYGKALYSSVIFSSQEGQHRAIQEILAENAKDEELKKDIRSTLSKAVMETGGVSIEKIESGIREHIEQLSLNWDEVNGEPKGGRHRRGISNPWRSKGTILENYYALEQLRDGMQRAQEAENTIQRENERLRTAADDAAAAQKEYDELNDNKAALQNRELLLKRQKDLTNRLENLKEALDRWPRAQDRYAKALALKKELENAKALERYTAVTASKNQYDDAEKCLASMTEVRREDIEEAGRAERTMERLKSRLSGMSLAARIALHNGNTVSVKSSLDGRELTGENGAYDITEAVTITIPEVADISLAPKDVDVRDIETQLRTAEAGLNRIFKTYAVQSVRELEEKGRAYDGQKQAVESAKRELEFALGGEEYQTIADRAPKDTENGSIRSVEEIETDIRDLCGRDDITVYLTRQEEQINRYRDAYHSRDELRLQIRNTEEESRSNLEKTDRLSDIPEKYSRITDIDAEVLQKKEAVAAARRHEENQRKRVEEVREHMPSKSAEEYEDEIPAAEEAFEDAQAELQHWKHIQSVFRQVQTENVGNPMTDIEDSFRRNLEIVSGGGVHLEHMDERMDDVKISSNGYYMTYDLLSEGTKDTISLAFRLAVLDHLFPDGGGLAVFDDPFTDMDADRRKAACELLRDFSERNQVIFITCDPQYESLLDGNVIHV